MQYEIWLINLDPTVGSEIKKTRPCIVISPNVMNRYLNTTIIVPLTSTRKDYPTRINCTFQWRKGDFVLDQIRTIDKRRFLKRLWKASSTNIKKISERIWEIFN